MDGFHRRGYRKSGATITDYYLYDENSRVVATLTASGAFKSVFLYASKSHVPEYFVTGSTKYKIVTDYLGSVRLVVRTSDNVVMQRMDYDEWGKVINDTKPGFQPFGFAGGLYDSETKLLRFGVREYEPSLGRWLSKDPIRFDGGSTNLFEYVGSDPVNGIDPSGLSDINLFPPDEPNYFSDSKISKTSPYFSVGGHGDPKSIFSPVYQKLTAGQISDLIKSNPAYFGQPIQLNSCQTGGSTADGSPNIAQQISDALGVTVIAPSDNLGVFRNSGRLTVFGSGQWRFFVPKPVPLK